MATIFSHAIVGASLVALLPEGKRSTRNYMIAATTAMIPDLDYFGFINQVPYASLWGHRGMTHSILFAILVAGLAAFFANRKPKGWSFGFFLLFFAATISHPLIDACTNGGLGVAFFSPYNLHRYFFAWHPIQVSPMGMSFFTAHAARVLTSEFAYIILPCVILVALRRMVKIG